MAAQAQVTSTKRGGLFARLFGENTAPSVADVQAQIAKVQQERADLAFQATEIEAAIAERWGEDTSDLEAQLISINAKAKAAGLVLERLQAEQTQARQREAVDTYREKVARLQQTVAELKAFEAGEFAAAKKAYEDAVARQRGLRIAVNQQQKEPGLLLQQLPPEVRNAVAGEISIIRAGAAECFDTTFLVDGRVML
jgi:hypothetical protein